ncbi:MAG: hypothetical protein ABIA02_02085 [Candidatus Falkowbacteria bacterium]
MPRVKQGVGNIKKTAVKTVKKTVKPISKIKTSIPVMQKNIKEQEVEKIVQEPKKISKADIVLETLNNDEVKDEVKYEEKKEEKENKSFKSETGGEFSKMNKENIQVEENMNINDNNKKRSLGIYKKIAFSFIILTAILFAVVFYFSYVKAEITVVPKEERISSDLVIDIFDSDKRSGTEDGGILGVIKQVEIGQTEVYSASDIEIIEEEVVGKVTLINNYNKNQPLVAKTRLLSPDNKLFRIKNTVNVPAGGTLEVDVYADEPSKDMVIGATQFTIPGLWAGLQDQIYGESKEPMNYSQIIKRYIKQDDIDDGVKDLKRSLLLKAESEIGEAYETYDQVIYEIDDNSMSQEIDGKVGEEKDEFSITMKTFVTVIAFNDEEIYEMAKKRIISILPDDKELTEFNKENIIYNLDNSNINQGVASVNVNLFGKMAMKEDFIVDKSKLLGLSRDQVEAYLDSLSEVSSHKIKFYPAFIKTAPNLIDRIEVKIESYE